MKSKKYFKKITMYMKPEKSKMKLDGSKSHGKVFEDDGERVWIWES